jgi:NADH-quinone oxidoreductase subunit F
MEQLKSASDLEELRKQILAKMDPDRPNIAICLSGCETRGSREILKAFEEELKKQGLEGKVDIRGTGCLGFCEQGPMLVIYPQEIVYFRVEPTDVPLIVSQTLIKQEIIERLLYSEPKTRKTSKTLSEVSFYKYQNRLLLENNAKVDPKKIEDYIALGGYSALSKALFQMKPEQVLEEVKKSNLRGRGGGGFPTGRKWESTRKASAEPKYIIVNCDEGDPGAFMNRALMDGNPHSILEGLIIGAYAIGSHEGFIYVRQEYPLAVENMQLAIEQAETYGLLGKDILGSGFDFKVEIHRGAGAFVSGESTALMTAIEGKVGEPRPKYVHTSEKGLWEKPSVLNNVETWANVPLIINNGAEWFASIGTEGSKGTKIFTLAGKVNNTGLVEIPLGVTLRDLIYEIGGGIRNGKKFKGVQTGGPSGGVIPEQYLDSPVDFDELVKLRSIMGSGGIIVMDSDTCMVDVARYFVNFLCDESCGKCVPCREGLTQAREILDNIVAGKGEEGDIERLKEIGEVTSAASLCALGQTAANPMLTTIRYFRDEYEAHIKEKRCPALSCTELLSFYIEPEQCPGCQVCARNCRELAIEGEIDKIHVIDQSKCTKCGSCLDVCPPEYAAVVKTSGEVVPQVLPEAQRWLKRPWRTAEIPGPKKARIVANPDTATTIIEKASRPVLVVSHNAIEIDWEGINLIDLLIDFARKSKIPVVAASQTVGEFIKRGYTPAASMSATEIGSRLVDPEWKGVDREGPHDMVLFVGLPYTIAFNLLSGLKHFAPNLITVTLDNMYNPQATWSFPNSSVKTWINNLKVMTSKFEKGGN